MDITNVRPTTTVDAGQLAARILEFEYHVEALPLERSIQDVDPSGGLALAVLEEIARALTIGIYETFGNKLPPSSPFKFYVEQSVDVKDDGATICTCSVHIIKYVDGGAVRVKLKSDPDWVGSGKSSVDAAKDLHDMLLCGDLDIDAPTEEELITWGKLSTEDRGA